MTKIDVPAAPPVVCALHDLGGWVFPCRSDTKGPLKKWKAVRHDPREPTTAWLGNKAEPLADDWRVVWAWRPADSGALVLDVDDGNAETMVGKWPPDTFVVMKSQKTAGRHVVIAWPDAFGKVQQGDFSGRGCAGQIRYDDGYAILWDLDALAHLVAGFPRVSDTVAADVRKWRAAAVTAANVSGPTERTADDGGPVKGDFSTDGEWSEGSRNEALYNAVIRRPRIHALYVAKAVRSGLPKGQADKTAQSAVRSIVGQKNVLLRHPVQEWPLDEKRVDSWAQQVPWPVRHCPQTGVWYRHRANKGWCIVKEAALLKDLQDWATAVAVALSEGDRETQTVIAGGFSDCTVERVAKRLATVRTIDAEAIDANPWAAGLPDGRLLDLRTGKTRAMRKSDGVCRRLGAVPEAGKPERWLRFLSAAVPDDDTREWLRLWFWYSLTGDTSAQTCVLLTGRKGAGKTTLAKALETVAGEHRGGTEGSNIARQMHLPHPTWVMDVAPLRVASIEEVPTGTWNETLKKLSEGRRTSARRMRKDWQEMTPRCKITMTANGVPDLIPGDGMARRLAIIRFATAPAESEIDHGLEAAWHEERGRILQWILDGRPDIEPDDPQYATKAARAVGMGGQPQAIRDARAAYEAEAQPLDSLIAHVMDHAEGDGAAQHFVWHSALVERIANVQGFAEGGAHEWKAPSTRDLNDALRRCGFKPKQSTGNRWRTPGAVLREQEADDAAPEVKASDAPQRGMAF